MSGHLVNALDAVAQHTPGRLEVLDGRRISVTIPNEVAGGFDSHCVALAFNTDGRLDAEANARRLVACWNACDGVETDLLEAAGDGLLAKSLKQVGHKHDALRSAEAQRDELLVALGKMNRAYVNLLESGRDRIVMLGGECDPVDVMEANDPNLRESRSAIAKVKGGAT